MQPNANRPNKILVVDDDARIRDLLRRYLTQEGFDVLLAEDGKSLTRIMLRETADLIVLDLMMPGEDGLSICRRLRAANDVTPIIMLTAKGEDIDRIVEIWTECLANYGGPYLFGAQRGMADAMFAPVVTRFLTYDVKLPKPCILYCQTIMAMPEMKEWVAAARLEADDIDELDMDF